MKNLFYLLLVVFLISCQKQAADFVFVKGGNFLMGSLNGDKDEEPVHSVALSNFYIMKTEVTQEMYEKIVGKKYPVTHVNWYDAIRFCNEWSIKDGLTPCYAIIKNKVVWNKKANGYRLPTEAEWEYAARGGIHKRDYEYSGSNSIDDVAWYISNTNGHPENIATKKPNDLGLYDMSGNAGEWCWDWEGDYSSAAKINPSGPSVGERKVLRSGSPYIYDYYCRVANREGVEPYKNMIDYGCIGFRVARNAE